MIVNACCHWYLCLTHKLRGDKERISKADVPLGWEEDVPTFPWKKAVSLNTIFLLQTQYPLSGEFSACSSMYFILTNLLLTFELCFPWSFDLTFIYLSPMRLLSTLFIIFPRQAYFFHHSVSFFFSWLAVLCCKLVTGSCLGLTGLSFLSSKPGFPVSSHQ